MRASLAVLFLLLAPPAPAQESAAPAAPREKRRLTLEDVIGPGRRVSFSGTPPAVRWADDGALIVGRGRDARRIDPHTGEERAEPSSGDGEAAERAERPDRTRPGRRSGGRAPAGGELAENSPDGKWVAFVKAGNLCLRSSEGGEEQPLTKDGGDEVLNGKLDWVYQEEVYGRGSWRAHWWSPDSKRIAFLRLDVKDEPKYPIVDLREAAPRTVEQRFPKPGEPNATVRLGVASVPAGTVRWIDLSEFPEDALVVRVGWTKDGAALQFMVQDRIQTWLAFCEADPATGAARRLIHEITESWVPRSEPPRWLEDGSFLWLSERTGFQHVYHYDRDGTLRRAVTSGEWQVRDIVRVDEEGGRLWFTGTRDGVVDQHCYQVRLDGTGLARITEEPGWHEISFNKKGDLLIDRWSSCSTPPRARLLDADGKKLRELGETSIPALETYAFTTREPLRIPTRSGVVLDGSLLKPPHFDPEKRHPVWLPTYSGPDAPSVRNRWDGSAWDQFLAHQGFLVLQVNVRSASGRGHKDTSVCYRRLGVPELEDLEDAVAWLVQNPWADAKRVGITGWSYGGFMAAYALTHSKAFRLGIAGAGVYDWRLYDTIYTERYMGLPSDNQSGYDVTSCVLGAKNLSGHLLLLHGTDDDNVHLQNLIQLVHALQKAEKTFEMMIYPGSGHGIQGAEQNRHRQRLAWEAMRRHLLE